MDMACVTSAGSLAWPPPRASIWLPQLAAATLRLRGERGCWLGLTGRPQHSRSFSAALTIWLRPPPASRHPGNADPGLGVRQVGRSTGQATWRSGGSACSAILRDGLPPAAGSLPRCCPWGVRGYVRRSGKGQGLHHTRTNVIIPQGRRWERMLLRMLSTARVCSRQRHLSSVRRGIAGRDVGSAFLELKGRRFIGQAEGAATKPRRLGSHQDLPVGRHEGLSCVNDLGQFPG
jgi:hypothetical protein